VFPEEYNLVRITSRVRTLLLEDKMYVIFFNNFFFVLGIKLDKRYKKVNKILKMVVN
jgi:beta-galactosidase beta subunit